MRTSRALEEPRRVIHLSTSVAPGAGRAPALLLLALAVALAAGACRRESAPRGRPDLLLVTLDTTRADRIGAYGGPAGATPHLDALAARAVVFERAYAVAPMTLPAHATILTGRLPTRTGVRWNGEQRLRGDVPTLAESFAAAGYATAAFVSAAVLDGAFGLERGFALYDDEIERSGEIWRAERSGAASADRALAWLDRTPADRPVFLWLHLFEPHDPYEPPSPYDRRFASDPYLGEIAAADAELGRLLAHPRWSSARSTIVAVLGDHGESLGEHGEATHGILLYDGALKVPFLLAAPGLSPRRLAMEVDQADVAPTLLELAGLRQLPGLDGTSLAAELGGEGGRRARALYAESLYAQFLYGWAPLRSTRRAGWKWIAGARNELFDTRHDAGELRNLAGERAAEAATLERALADVRAREEAPSDAANAPLDGELSEKLRSLGYLGGGVGAPAAGAEVGAGDPRDLIAVHERMRRIDAHLRAGELDAAQAELRRVLLENPDNRMANLAVERQVRASLERGGREGASGGSAALRIVLAQALVAQGRREEARAELVLAADGAAPTPAELNARAFARLELGRVEEARRDWQTLAERAPASSDARLNLASLALSQRRFAEAERWARAALAVDPSSAAAHNSLAIALEEQGRDAPALDHYRAALAAAPEYWQARLNLGLLQARTGLEGEAIASLQQVLQRAPREPLVHLALGQLLAKRPRDRAAARGHLEAFLKLAPTHPKAPEARLLLDRLASLGVSSSP